MNGALPPFLLMISRDEQEQIHFTFLNGKFFLMFIEPYIIVITEESKNQLESYLSLQPGHYSSLTAPNLQPTADQERNDQFCNQHHSRELLMMGIVMLETC